MSEIPIDAAQNKFLGKTIQEMDTSCCNNIQFLFTDGSRVALHIEVDRWGLPDVQACDECATIGDSQFEEA